uniref:Uncharacterized protein n=1 Tax=Meloidogyne hapla TaxID=6305 RepID=A0A1I8BBQ3_MELHA
MSVFNEVKILTTSTAINIGNTNTNLSPDFLSRNTPNSTRKTTSPTAIIDSNGGEATPTTPVANDSNSSTPNANSRVHNENPTQLKALIIANEQALKLVQDFGAAGPDSKQRTILTTSCSAASLGAYAAMQSTNNTTGTPPIFGNGKITNTSGVGLYPAQRSNSAIVAYLNGLVF